MPSTDHNLSRQRYERSAARFPAWYAVSFDPPKASKRAMALIHAAACRELWREHHDMTTEKLMEELKMHEFHLSDYCRPYRSDNLRRVSLWYVRMIRTELNRRNANT